MGFKCRFIFTVLVYLAGFATAIYVTTPDPANELGVETAHFSLDRSLEKLKSEEFAQNFGTGMKKCFKFGKEAAIEAGTYLKQKLDEQRES